MITEHLLDGEVAVTATREDVRALRGAWPLSDLPDRAITFVFDRYGDLIAMEGADADGPDVIALSQDARRAVLYDALDVLGYRPCEDAWGEHGRVTFVHDDDADRPQIKVIARTVRQFGYEPHPTQLRAFAHPSGGIIEVEPGGGDCSGHFLHHIDGRRLK